jgi:hypothetical protein
MNVSGCALLLSGCVASCVPATVPNAPQVRLTSSNTQTRGDAGADFARVEDEALQWLAAEDPRLATRFGLVAPEWMLNGIRTDAVLREDVKAVVRGGSLDIFAFEARDLVLRRVASLVGDDATLPASDEGDSRLRQSRLELVLAQRLVSQERARLDDEMRLGDASGDLVRVLIDELRVPASKDENVERDAWVARRLLEIQGSLGTLSSRGGRRDLDTALYPLERLLSSAQFPKAARALVDLRIAMDADTRPLAELPELADVIRRVRTHIGVLIDPGDFDERLSRLATAIRGEIDRRMSSSLSSPSTPNPSAASRADLEARARGLLLGADSCPCESETRVGCMPPSPERRGVCGILRALTEVPERTAVLIALHDDVVVARTVLGVNVPVRTSLLSRAPTELVDQLLDTARTRPIFVLGIALAADLLYASDGSDARIACWRRLGDVPLDIAALECAPRAR